MSSRTLPGLGLVGGVLVFACTPTTPTLTIESPDDELLVAEAESIPDEPETEPETEPEPPEIDRGDDLPEDRCEVNTTPRKAVEIDDPQEPGGGRLMTALPDGRVMGLPLEHTSFDTIVVGTVAETTVVQRFSNPMSDPIEVVYTFPLPHDGAVDDYWLRIGTRRIQGEIHRRQEAREIYEEARDAGLGAGLLEQERPNIFTQSVANVAPGEAIEVSMHVVQPLRPDEGRYELVLPTVVGPRYIPGAPRGGRSGTGMVPDTDVVSDASRITPPILPPSYRSCGDLEIDVSIDAGGPISALATRSHRVEVEPDHLGAMVRLDERYALLDRDFVLSWRRDGDDPEATLQAQPDDDGGFFTLTVQPPARIDPEDVPGRELVFVLDTSGSMSGAPMDVSKATMRRFIEGLAPDDAFQVIRFSESASGLGDELLSPTPDNVERALAYVDGLSGGGGTAMTEGIRAALSLPHREDRVRYVVFLTDGYIGNEKQIFELIAETIDDTRLFSMGVGSSVNRYLLDGMARMGRGSVTYVDLEQPTGPVVDRLYRKLRQPALVDLELEIEGLDAHDVVPDPLPDLFMGEPVVLFGRYQGALKGRVVIRGRRGDEHIEIPVALEEVRDEDVDGIRSMWARGRIDQLQFDPALSWASQARRESVEANILGLSLHHRVLTEYTAFVAVDHTRVVDGRNRGRTIIQGVHSPSGVAHESVWGHVGLPGGDDGSGSGSGYGSGSGSGFGGRGKRVPRIRRAYANVKGGLGTIIIKRIVRAHIGEVRRCYNRGLLDDPTLAGRVEIQFTIDPRGRVPVAVVASTELADKSVGMCIAKAVKRWKFPRGEGGGTAVVTYPFVLSTDGVTHGKENDED